MTPYLPGPDVVPEQYANDFKPQPFINIVHHGGRWLAMSEVDPPWEVTSGFEAASDAPFTWGGAIPGACAHPRIDPATGEMVLFRYDLGEPYLTWSTVAADGTVTHAPDPIEIDGSYMIHDFVITTDHLVLFVAPAKFDLNALLTGSGPPLGWHPDLPLRIAVIPRAGTSKDVQWIETDPFWVYHFANAFADGDDIVVDLAKWKEFALGPAPDQTGAAVRARIDTKAGTVALDPWFERICEFPRIDDRLVGSAHRYFTMSTKHDLGSGSWNVLTRVDTQTGAVAEWDSGTKVFDEVVFAPARRWCARGGLLRDLPHRHRDPAERLRRARGRRHRRRADRHRRAAGACAVRTARQLVPARHLTVRARLQPSSRSRAGVRALVHHSRSSIIRSSLGSSGASSDVSASSPA